MSAEIAAKPAAAAPAKKEKNPVVYWVGVVVGLFLMFVFGRVCPAWGAVTPMGVNMIGIFIGLLLLITVTGELIWPALAALVATVLCGYMTGGDIIAKFMGTTTILQVIAILVICAALRSTGAGAVIAKKIVTAKFVQGRPLVFTMFFLIAFCSPISFWIPSAASCFHSRCLRACARRWATRRTIATFRR